MKRLVGAMLLVALAGCERNEPPVERVAETAESIVDPAATAPAPMAGRLAPRDECPAVEGASAFRARLAAAVRARDAAAFSALAAEDIKLDFGGGSGAHELRRRLADPEGRLWQELEEMLPLGCAENEQGGITIPWIAAQDVPADDPGSATLVTGSNVPVRERAEPGAPVIGTVSWDVVELSTFRPEAPFQQIELPDGAVGYVDSTALRSMLDHRLTAARRNDRWTITSFVAGD